MFLVTLSYWSIHRHYPLYLTYNTDAGRQCVNARLWGLFACYGTTRTEKEKCKHIPVCSTAVAFFNKQKDASNRRTKCQRCYILWCDFDAEDNVPSHSLSHNKHSLWHGGLKSKVHSDVLACHKSKVKCSVWSPWSSCWNAFVDHTVSCFVSHHVSMGLDRAMEGLMRVKIDLPLSGQWPSPELGQTEQKDNWHLGFIHGCWFVWNG